MSVTIFQGGAILTKSVAHPRAEVVLVEDDRT